ncbi:MAG: response regulator [Sedimentisphaerales bacterium]|nr:response regulator [Sedimentisphaerales bacterium]
MKANIKALVVEDDLKIQEEIEDVLGLLDHDHDWAESQQEARELIERNVYHYVLADLEIPARTGRGFAKIEYGKKLIEQIQQIKGRGVMPVILMTCYHKDGLNLVMELLGNGVMDFISKPFGDGTSGKSLPQVIQGVLEKHRKAFPPGVLPGDPPKPFQGGTLAFYPDHIELEGEMVLERGGPGHAWEIIQALRTPRDSGKLPRLSAPRLAKAIDPHGQISDGAINSCIHTLRTNITETMLANARLTVGRDDVIANLGKGYHLADWLLIERHDAKTSPYVAEPPVPEVTHLPEKSAKDDPNGQEPLTDRQHWILDQLRQGVRLTRGMVEEQFHIKDKQTKRELAGLSKRGMIEFIRKPRPGYYILVSKSRRSGKAQ